jgi:hypothetical protein
VKKENIKRGGEMFSGAEGGEKPAQTGGGAKAVISWRKMAKKHLNGVTSMKRRACEGVKINSVSAMKHTGENNGEK